MKRLYPVALLVFLLLFSCGRADKTITSLTGDTASGFIQSHTTGLVSTEGQIIVTLAEPPETRPERGSRFQLEPPVRGRENWIDERTIAFTPDRPLRPGSQYQVRFRLGELFSVPDDLKEVSFGFNTIHQDMEVRVDDILLADDGDYVVRGSVLTADAAASEDVKRTIRTEVDGRVVQANWPESSSRRQFDFELIGISRSGVDAMLRLRWDGSAIGTNATGIREIPIPAEGTFSLLDTRVIHDENPHIELTFSDILDQRQQLRGLIRLGDDDRLNTIIQGNRIRIFFPQSDDESQTLHIDRGIRSMAGRNLDRSVETRLRIKRIEPGVRLSGRSVILPASENMLIPFEAIGLGAVDVQIHRIYESGIPQFLQVNTLSGDNELRRVGKSVAGKTIPLATLGTFNPDRWTSYALDLSALMEAEPGAMYRVTFGFRPHHRAIACPGETLPANFAELDASYWMKEPVEEQQWWNNIEHFWWPDNYIWRDRNNPCSDSYYVRNRWSSRNLLGSDLGIIAKAADTGDMEVFVTDLQTTRSRQNVDITVYNYQLREMAQARTNRDGHAKIHLPGDDDAFLLIASDGNSKGYVRLESGQALSLSTFDVSGASMQEGLKGYLYGERGVWRPGDSLFVSLIIQDETGRLPANHPVLFELRNPLGQLADRRNVPGGKNGFYTFTASTDTEAPTGIWNVTAHAGGAQFSRNLRVETIRPNRLDIKLDLDKETLLYSDRYLSGIIHSNWLHGAPASNLKTDISLTLESVATRFTSYTNYVFDDITRSWSSSTETIFEGQLDSNGKTTFRYTLPEITESPGRLAGRLSTRVFEGSGNYSTHRSRFDIYPYRYYVGLQLPEPDAATGGLDRNSEHELQIITIDDDGSPVSRRGVEVTIYEMGWRWWWQQPGDGSGVYFSTRNLEPLTRMSIDTDTNGEGRATFRLGDTFGRILVRVEDPASGHASSDLAYVGYSWRDDDGTTEGPARLAIRTDHESYSTGEKAAVVFPSAAGNRALISLESGSRILRSFWVDTEQGETRVPVEITSEMSPNIYAHVMMLQPHGQMNNDLPIRLYGVVPVMVEDPDTRLNPVLKLPDETKPNSTFTVNVSEENRKAMTYTLAVVDEGLLSLTNFRTPDPHAHFYAREALGVKTWDMFDHVAGPFTGSLSRILSIGGDRDAGEVSREPEVTRFKPVVRFLGPFHLENGREASHEIEIPNYIGSVRVMLVAGNQNAYGNASGNVPVRQSLMALAALPRMLGPGEQVNLPVTVFTGINTSGRTEISTRTTPNISIADTDRLTLQLGENDQQLAIFDLNVANRTGRAEITTTATLGEHEASDTIELEIRNPNPPVTRIHQQLIQPGESWTAEPGLPGIEGTNRVTLEISAIAPLDLERRLRNLIHYPHGCLEQIVSGAFPQLYLSAFHELSNEQQSEIEEHISETIRAIRAFQTPSGSLAYWPGRSDVNEWSNVYAWHFLVEAGRTGYSVPQPLIAGVERSLRAKTLSWRPGSHPNDALLQAYRLYVLALNGTAELGAMNRLREHRDMPAAARWRLAAAYQLAGQSEAAISVSINTPKTVDIYRERGYTFGSQLRDQAMILEALSLMDRRTEAVDLAARISARLSSRDWLSTQETAFSLIAMARYLEDFTVSEHLQAVFSYGNQSGTITSVLPVSTLSLDPDAHAGLKVENNGDGVIYARLLVSGTPLQGDTEPASNALGMDVRYLNMDGEEINPARLIQGTDIVIESRVTHPGTDDRYTEMALTQIMPSGWEIHNTRMDEITFSEAASVPQYQDIRDDRVLTYFSLNPGETKVFRTVVNASFAGRFYLPSVSAYAMYDERVFAHTGGAWVEVVQE